MRWFEAVAKVTPYVVKIETQDGHGTGFLCLYNDSQTLCGIATAHHVVEQAETWKQPVRIIHTPSSSQRFLPDDQRVIFTDPKNDSAVVLFPPGALDLPKELIAMAPPERHAKVGVEAAWLGYPSVAPHTLCFFRGSISAQRNTSYLIDGVAINGVSGGPVFHIGVDDKLRILGAMSAYSPNLASNMGTLPGLSVAQDVTHFQEIVGRLKSLAEAREKQEEQEKAQEAQADDGPRTSLPSSDPRG